LTLTDSSTSRALTIRPPTVADSAGMASLLDELGYPAHPDALPARLERLAADPRAAVLLAERAGDAIGLITVHLRDTINHEEPLAQLTALVVAGRARGQGVGRALVAAAERWARGRGARRVVVSTALDRADAHHFYEGLGFVHTGRRYARSLSD
jgi:GNAT superfamily N-acetyltransferase